MSGWIKWEDRKPKAGSKVVVLCDDGCSAGLFFVADEGNGAISMLNAEDGYDTLEGYPAYFNGAIWAEVPEDTVIAFMEDAEYDWN